MEAKELTYGFPPLVVGENLVAVLKDEANEHFQKVAQELAVVVGRLHQTCLHLAIGDEGDQKQVPNLSKRIAAFSDAINSEDMFATNRKFKEGDCDYRVLPLAIRRALDGDLVRLKVSDLEKDWVSFVDSLLGWGMKAMMSGSSKRPGRIWVSKLVNACLAD